VSKVKIYQIWRQKIGEGQNNWRGDVTLNKPNTFLALCSVGGLTGLFDFL